MTAKRYDLTKHLEAKKYIDKCICVTELSRDEIFTEMGKISKYNFKKLPSLTVNLELRMQSLAHELINRNMKHLNNQTGE